MRAAAVVVAIPLLTCGGGRIVPTTRASAEDPFVRLGRLDTPEFIEIQEVRAIDGGRVAMCTAVRGFYVLSVDATGAMSVEHQLASRHGHERFPRCQHLAVDGDHAYITSRGDEVQAAFVATFDLSGSPRELAKLPIDGAFEGVAARDGRVYVARHADGVAILERDGDDHRLAATVTGLVNAWAVEVAGGHLLVADGEGGVAFVSLADPHRPAIVKTIAIDGSARGLAVNGDHAYVAAGAGGIVVLDIAEPSSPRFVTQIETPTSVQQVSVSGTHLYAAAWGEVRVLDIAVPSAPLLVASERITSDAPFTRVLGIAAVGDIAFVGEWTGLYAYRLHPARVAPEIRVDEDAIELGRVDRGERRVYTVLVENEGRAPLTVGAVTASAPFQVHGEPTTIGAGSAVAVQVTYVAGDDGDVSGRLVIESDDPDESTLTIPIRANREGLAVGQPAPPFDIGLLDGRRVRLADLAGKPVLLSYFATF